MNNTKNILRTGKKTMKKTAVIKRLKCPKFAQIIADLC